MTDATLPIDPEILRKDFPLLSRSVHGRPIVYLDSASSSLQPRQVLTAMEQYYETTHANVHRGVYANAEEATRLYEAARVAIGRFIGAPSPQHEIVFTKNCTEAINLVAHSWARPHLRAGDVVVLTEMEHHADIVPWLMLAEERDIELRYLPIDDDGRLVLDDLDRLLDGAKLLGVAGMSNVLGTINPVTELAEAAHRAGALILVDGAQSVPHHPVDVRRWDADFLTFSAHKMFGPTGIGVLWARRALLEDMPPFLGGGSMILDVRLDRFVPADPPQRFEAGTPPIAEAVGLTAAVEFLRDIGMERIHDREAALTRYALEQLASELGADCRVFGPPAGPDRGGVLSLELRDVHPHDVAQVLDTFGVCIRPGHHCAKPLMRRLGVPATARASLAAYNEEHDIDVLIQGLREAGRLFW
jgi:cysteine desulfurase / selenocysteine lyase